VPIGVKRLISCSLPSGLIHLVRTALTGISCAVTALLRELQIDHVAKAVLELEERVIRLIAEIHIAAHPTEHVRRCVNEEIIISLSYPYAHGATVRGCGNPEFFGTLAVIYVSVKLLKSGTPLLYFSHSIVSH
jgi:hypothetical protein